MHSSISSSDRLDTPEQAGALESGGLVRLRVLLGCGWTRRWQILLIVLLVLVVGETYMRLPFVVPTLEYEPHADLDGRLAPSQLGYLWLANMSLQSPPIRLNRDGHRGGETDWSSPVILAVGDSEWFGAGVAEAEVWGRVLEDDLRRSTGRPTLQVVNASHPGYGPYHQFVVVRRLLAVHPVEIILVRVSIGQRSFRPVPEHERARRVQAARVRQRIRRITRFLPFLVNKVQAQWPSIEDAFTPTFLRSRGARTSVLTKAAGRAMWEHNRIWWEQLAALAESRGVPVVFVIHDVEALPASAELEGHLGRLAQDHRGAHVVRLGPEQFGLDASKAKQLHAMVYETLTLRRDSHANPLQHRLIAQALRFYLDENGLTARFHAGTTDRVLPPRSLR